MFQVKWVARARTDEPVDVETSAFRDINNVVAFCQAALFGMRARFAVGPPDGFIVVDAEGSEVRRWFLPNSDTATI